MQVKALLMGLFLMGSAVPVAAADLNINVIRHDGPREPPPPLPEEHYRERGGYFWIAGHHEWRHGHYVWRRGHFVRERRGYDWNAGRWEHHNDHYDWHRGGWRPHR